jgi:hypothetical protein
MSMDRMFTIVCDQCGHSGDNDGAYGSSAAHVREYALENGWKRRGSKDICFSCANPEEEEEIENNAPIQDVWRADHA